MFYRINKIGFIFVTVILIAISLSSSFAHCPWHSGVTIPGGTTPEGPGGTGTDNGPPQQNPTTDGEPVLLNTGEYFLSVQDLFVRGRGLPVVLERSYRSRSEYNSRFGYGWDINYNLKVRNLHDPNVLVLLDGQNRKLEYTLDPDSDPNSPVYISPPGLYDHIQENISGTYTMYKKHGTKLDFDIDGNLTAITDRNGNSITFEYDPAGLLPLNGHSDYFVGQDYGLIALEFKLISITDDIGRQTNLTYDTDGRVSAIADFAGRTWTYTYDPCTNDLLSVTGPATGQYPSGLTTTYAYDDKHNLISITDPNGQTYLVNHYDSNDRIDWQTYGDGQYTFNYDPNNNTTTVIDRKGFQREVVYNATRNPISETTYTQGLRPGDPNCYTTTYEYNSNMEKTRVVYPAGNCIDYTYDDKGNLLKIRRGIGPGEDGWWEFDEGLGATTLDSSGHDHHGIFFGDPQWVTGKIGSYALDFDGVDDYVEVTDFTLGEKFTVTMWVNPLNIDDGQCFIGKYTSVGENIFLFGFWNGGYNVAVRNQDYLSGTKTIGWQHLAVIVEQISSSSSNVTVYKDGEVLWSQTLSSAAGDMSGKPWVIAMDWDGSSKTDFFNGTIDDVRIYNKALAQNEITSIMNSDSDSLVTTFTYEPNFDFVKTITDPNGNVTTYIYDYEDPNYGTSVGNLTKITYPTVGVETPEVSFTYNQFGQIETTTAPDGIVTKYEYYDAIEPNGPGLLRRVITDYGVEPNCLNITTEFRYDIMGNMVEINDAEGNVSQFKYDNLDQLIQSITPAPSSYVTNFWYDKNKNLAQIDRQTSDPNNPWQVTSFTYNILDKLETQINPLGHVTSFGYDENENRSLIIDAEDNNSVYVYDERDLLWKVTDALGNTTEYSYDENGNLKEIKDAKGNVTTYTYDGFDRLITVTYPDNSSETYTYDKNSNLISKKTRANETFSYEYDELNRLTEKTIPDAPAVTYTYDIASRLIAVTQGSDTITYDYDKLSRIANVTYPDGKELAYEYDSLGRRTKLTYPDDTFITYEYDELSRLTDVVDDSNTVLAHYSYDALSRRIEATFANGTSTTYYYDLANRLTNLSNHDSSWSKTYDYTYDNVGNRLSMTVDSTHVHNYWYDNIYQLTDVQYPATTTVNYNYDALGNRTSVVNGGTTNYVSNNLNQYTSVAGVSFTYDDNGNLTNDGSSTYTYDSENRLTMAVVPGALALYEYDPMGRRIHKNVNGQITKFCYDGDQVICETDNAGTIIAKYIYGPGIDEPIAMIRVGGTYYYAFDGLGSVVALSDVSGNLVETYSYDVFGQPNSPSGVGNPHLFTGRRYDSETGLYYYRSRYYDSCTGRFLQTDPAAYLESPNLYKYCSNNPLNYVDPYGLCGLGDEKPETIPWYDIEKRHEIVDEWFHEIAKKGYWQALLISIPETIFEIGIGTAEIGQKLGKAWGTPGAWSERSEATGRAALEVIGTVTGLKSVNESLKAISWANKANDAIDIIQHSESTMRSLNEIKQYLPSESPEVDWSGFNDPDWQVYYQSPGL